MVFHDLGPLGSADVAPRTRLQVMIQLPWEKFTLKFAAELADLSTETIAVLQEALISKKDVKIKKEGDELDQFFFKIKAVQMRNQNEFEVVETKYDGSAEARFSPGELPTLPEELPPPQQPEFTIVTQTPEQLVIQFPGSDDPMQRKAKHALSKILLIFFLIPIPIIVFGVLLSIPLSPIIRERVLTSAVATSLSLFWGIGVILFLVLSFKPNVASFQLDVPHSIVNLHTYYMVRKLEKDMDIPIKDIAGVRQVRIELNRASVTNIQLELHTGRKIVVYGSSKNWQGIHELYDILHVYLPGLESQIKNRRSVRY